MQERNSGANQQKGKMSWGLMLSLWYVALVLIFGVMIGTNLIPAWGKWYSKDLAFRRQTQALQRGTMTVDTSPKILTPAIAWTSGGVQQIEGLGVPFWRLPFETLAKVLEQRGFPDRLALGVFMALALFWMLRVLMVPLPCRNMGEWISALDQHPETIACIFILALSPPFLSLCRTMTYLPMNRQLTPISSQ